MRLNSELGFRGGCKAGGGGIGGLGLPGWSSVGIGGADSACWVHRGRRRPSKPSIVLALRLF